VKRPAAFHPPLFALHAPLALYAANVSLIPWQDTVLPMAAAAGIGLALWGALWLALRDGLRSAAAASVLIYLFSAFSLFGDFTGVGPLASWAIAAVPLAVAVAWKSRINAPMAVFFNIAGTGMCALAALAIFSAHWGIRAELAKLPRPLPGSRSDASAERPDIFYIVLDGYGRTDVFERLYGFSDSGFTHGLSKLGFYVAKDARANYCQTELSMASALNMRPVEELVSAERTAPQIRAVLDDAIDDSAVARTLKQKGYRYIALTTGFPALRFRTADVRLERDAASSLYLDALMAKTPLAPAARDQISQFDRRRKFLRSGFENLRQFAQPAPQPKFVVMHVLAPHPPFVFGPNGEPVRPKGGFGFYDGSHFMQMVGDVEAYREGYRGQARHIAQLTFQAIKQLVNVKGADPIILIQGDHGPKSALDQDSLERTDVTEAFPILAAYRVPDSVRPKLYPGITPINSFRLILRELWGEDFPPLPDRSHYSPWEAPLRLTDVTDRL
jgi:hypothetical protein